MLTYIIFQRAGTFKTYRRRIEKIGEKLFISERTIEAHRRNIFIKTKTKSIVGLMKYVIQEGLISF